MIANICSEGHKVHFDLSFKHFLKVSERKPYKAKCQKCGSTVTDMEWVPEK